MAAGEIHAGDVGLVFLATVRGGSGPLDVSSASVLRILLQKPDASTLTVDAYAPNGGSDGLVGYATRAGDLDQAGTWRIQVYVEVGSLRVYSDVAKFKVFANLGV